MNHVANYLLKEPSFEREGKKILKRTFALGIYFCRNKATTHLVGIESVKPSVGEPYLA